MGKDIHDSPEIIEMSRVSTELSETARKTFSVMLQALALVNNGELAASLNIDASTFSRFLNEKKSSGMTNLEMLSELLAKLGLKIVSVDDVYCTRETAEATRTLLQHAVNSPDYMRILFK